MTGRRTTASKRQGLGKVPSHAKLDAMIEEAIVDAYVESEQRGGFITTFEDNLATPFQMEVLGVKVAWDYYESFDVNSKSYIDQSTGTSAWIAKCRRLLDRCVAEEKKGDSAEIRQAIDIIFGLLDQFCHVRYMADGMVLGRKEFVH